MNHKIGIIGYGVMGKTRHTAITEIKKGTVVAISEPSAGALVNGVPNVSHDEIISSPEVNVIIVCTPNFLNKELAIRGLSSGKHVFCEKPPAFSGSDMEEVCAVEAASGKKLMYGFNHRHHDSIIHMKKLIEGGALGKILWLRGRYGKSVTNDFFSNWRAKKELAGGGILMDQGIHMLDLFLYLSGDFDVVKAELSNLYWHMDVEDNAFVILKESATGKVASLHSTMTQWRHLFSLEIFLEKGYMVLNGLNTSTMSYGEETLSVAKNRSTAPAATWRDEVTNKYINNNSWRYEMEHFFKSIEQDTPITIGNSDDALKLMRIIDKVYEQRDF